MVKTALPISNPLLEIRRMLHLGAYLYCHPNIETRILAYCPACQRCHIHERQDAQIGDRLLRATNESCLGRRLGTNPRAAESVAASIFGHKRINEMSPRNFTQRLEIASSR